MEVLQELMNLVDNLKVEVPQEPMNQVLEVDTLRVVLSQAEVPQELMNLVVEVDTLKVELSLEEVQELKTLVQQAMNIGLLGILHL